MFKKLHSKLILMIFLILVLNAGVIIYFTMSDVGKAMLKTEKSAAKNIFHLVRLNLEEEYSNLLEEKINSIKQRKKQLKAYSEIILTGIEHLAISEDQQSQKRALKWIQSTNGKFAKAFIAGPQNRVLYYSDSRMIDKDISKIKDIKGRAIPEIVKSPSISPSGQYAVFSWENQIQGSKNKQFGYFTSFEQWNWTVGALIDISDIEAEAQKKLEGLKNTLKKTFAKIDIAESGSLFLFNKQLKLLIEPHQDSINPSILTENLLQKLIQSTDDQEQVRITINNQELNFHTGYFKSLNWYVSALIPVQEIKEPARKLVLRQSLIVSLVFVVALILAIWFVQRISKPLQMLAAYVKTVPEQDFTAQEEQEFPINYLPEKHKDEVGALAESFLYMHSELRNNIQKLMEATATKERIQGELNVARDIQLGILPKIFPPFPERKEFDLHAFIEPAKEVGGDFYDFYLLDEDRLCLTIGDVSDKGAPAALFMAITKTLIKSYTELESSPAKIVEKVNNDLSQDNPNCMFVTLFIGILHISTGKISYANAGHNPPILFNKATGPYYLRGTSGPVAGALEKIKYKELEIKLDQGDGLFLYTDGVTEAMNIYQELYSEERLLKALKSFDSGKAKEIIDGITDNVKDFVGPALQSDDITMLMLWFMKKDQD